MRKILIFLLLILIISPYLFALEKEKAVSIYKEKLIIANFANKSAWKELGSGLSDDIVVLFAQTKRFDIIERDQLVAVLKEQELQMSGIVNEADAVRIGQLIGANYIIFGSITTADGSHKEQTVTKKFKDKSSGQVVYKDYIVTTWEGRVTISSRLVEIKTGQIIVGKSVTSRSIEKQERAADDKTFLQSIISALASKDNSKAMEAYHKQMHQKVVNSAREKAAYQLVTAFLKEFPLTGYVLGEDEGGYLIDLGTGKGMNAKVNLKIHGESKEMKHPVTGEVMKVRTKTLGYFKVTDLGDSASTVKLVKGDKEDVMPGLKIEVVDPIFIWHRALASFIIPGLGQLLEGRWGSGIMFLLCEGALVGGGFWCYYRSTDAFLKKQELLDDRVWTEDTRKQGDQYKKARTQALVGMWVFIGCEAIIHIWDTINGGYPAEKNKIFVRNSNDEGIKFAFNNSKYENNYCLKKSFRF